MKQSQKDQIRSFIINQLYELDNLRLKLDDLANTHNIDRFETMEFYEQEVERINKLFNYPAQLILR
jgi:hypothetical protein